MDLWAQLTEVLSLPIVINNDKSQESFYDYGSFYEYFMELGRKGAYIQRYKGLGEMNPEQLWETTLNPANRHLLQVTIDDAIAADEIFSVLMGESVEPRKNFISENALSVKELDV
jgi:DNA gyrase subunit B